MIGRLLDEQNQPLRGAMVSNPIGRAFTENDGFFALEASRRQPEFSVEHNGSLQCDKSAGDSSRIEESDIMLLGELKCTPLVTSKN